MQMEMTWERERAKTEAKRLEELEKQKALPLPSQCCRLLRFSSCAAYYRLQLPIPQC